MAMASAFILDSGEVEPEPAEEAAGSIDPDGGHPSVTGIDHLLLKGRVAIMVKICCLLLRATAVPISGLLLGAAKCEEFERPEDQDCDDSKEAGRPAGNQALPTV
jgi:hypothetical protein